MRYVDLKTMGICLNDGKKDKSSLIITSILTKIDIEK